MKTILLSLAILFAINVSAQLTTIYDIQGQTDVSPLDGDIVTTSGVVTALVRADGFVIQDGETPWNGLYVYYGSDAAPTDVQIGDELEIQGQVGWYYGLTQLASIISTNTVSTGNTVNPISLTTQETNEEKYESMLATISSAECVSAILDHGEYEFNDGSGVATIDDKIWSYTADDEWVPVFGDDYTITGIISYSFDLYRVYPRDINDVTTSSIEGNQINGLEIFPNPVNNGVVYLTANTNISKVNVFNVVGQNVKSIQGINENQTSINVTDLNKGMYILKIETINGKTNTHKITVK